MSKESSHRLSEPGIGVRARLCKPSSRIGDWSFDNQVSGVATGSAPALQAPFVQAEAGAIAWGNRRQNARA